MSETAQLQVANNFFEQDKAAVKWQNDILAAMRVPPDLIKCSQDVRGMLHAAMDWRLTLHFERKFRLCLLRLLWADRCVPKRIRRERGRIIRRLQQKG